MDTHLSQVGYHSVVPRTCSVMLVGAGRFSVRGGGRVPLRQVLVVCRCEQADERSGCDAEVVKGAQSFFFGGLGWLSNDAGVGVGAAAEGRQVATVGCAVVGCVRAVAHVWRVRGEQDGRFEFAGVHIVVVAAGDVRGDAGFGPVFAAGVAPYTERSLEGRLTDGSCCTRSVGGTR
jgi:hypothetical protein